MPAFMRARSGSEIQRSLARIRALLDAERVERAQSVLRGLLRLPLDDSIRFQVGLLEMECVLVTRDFAALLELGARLRSRAPRAEDRSEVDLLVAHTLVLSGRVREAVCDVVPIVRAAAPTDARRARGFRILGLACYRTGHYRWAKSCLQRAEAFYRLHGPSSQLVRALVTLSLVAKSEGRIHLALSHLDEAARLLPRRGCVKTRLRLHLNRGICLTKLGRLLQARTSFLEAHGLASEEKDTFLVVSIYNNLGHVYRLEGNPRVAVEYHERALSLARAAGSDRQVCLSLEFLGETHHESDDAVRALRHLEEAMELARKLAPQGDLMMEVLRRRGEVLSTLGDLDAARQDLDKAIRLCRSRGERRELVLARRSHALVGSSSDAELAASLREVLAVLEELEDRFEYGRTVYLILKDGRLKPERTPWLRSALAMAMHYFEALGSKIWEVRLQHYAGPARALVEPEEERPRQPLPPEFVSRSSAQEAMLEAVRVAARGSLPVLILGETGAGKEIAARLVHQASSRSRAPMLAINCGALPENLVESELFGHVQGAFTGAGKDKPGLLEAAEGGTILLDEVGDLPMPTQVKLLRFLDTGELRRVGETRLRRADVRVLASTNRDLEKQTRTGAFREDLLYRLNAFRIEVPPLRERREDILPLAEWFLQQMGQSEPHMHLSKALESWLVAYAWPGNVRELRNLCGYLSARAWGKPEIELTDLPASVRRQAMAPSVDASSPAARARQGVERAQIHHALRETRGHITEAARLLGMGRNTVASLKFPLEYTPIRRQPHVCDGVGRLSLFNVYPCNSEIILKSPLTSPGSRL